MEHNGEADLQSENSRGDKEGDHTEAEPEILPDDAACLAAQADRERKMVQVIRHQRHIGGLQCHV